MRKLHELAERIPAARGGRRMPQGRTERSRSMEKGIGADGTIRASANSLVVLVAALLMAPSFASAAQDAAGQFTQPTQATQPYQRTTDDYNHRLAALDGN